MDYQNFRCRTLYSNLYHNLYPGVEYYKIIMNETPFCDSVYSFAHVRERLKENVDKKDPTLHQRVLGFSAKEEDIWAIQDIMTQEFFYVNEETKRFLYPETCLERVAKALFRLGENLKNRF